MQQTFFLQNHYENYESEQLNNSNLEKEGKINLSNIPARDHLFQSLLTL